MATLDPDVQQALHEGQVIPAHPLALTPERRLDERRQRGLTRYYLDAGAGGLAVGVHTTQFAIRDVGLLEPVLRLASEEVEAAALDRTIVRVAGICGPTAQALEEATLARDLGYDVALLSPYGMEDPTEFALLQRAEAVTDVLPVFGFYLQPAVGGRALSYDFWRAFCELPGVAAIKISPFDRYATLDVVRAAAASSRGDAIALYTGNDDAIVADLLTPFDVAVDGRIVRRRIVGGLLGQWSVGTRAAVDLLDSIKRVRETGDDGEVRELLRVGAQLTDANAAIFDAANGFAGCIAGIHAVLHAQGLLQGTWCLDPHEVLSPGQTEEIERVRRAYPHLSDDAFIAEHRTSWLG